MILTFLFRRRKIVYFLDQHLCMVTFTMFFLYLLCNTFSFPRIFFLVLPIAKSNKITSINIHTRLDTRHLLFAWSKKKEKKQCIFNTHSIRRWEHYLHSHSLSQISLLLHHLHHIIFTKKKRNDNNLICTVHYHDYILLISILLFVEMHCLLVNICCIMH